MASESTDRAADDRGSPDDQASGDRGFRVRELCVRHGRVQVVHDLSLDLAPGRILTMIGANGAGKSSTLNGIMGRLNASGSIVVEGHEMQGLGVEERVHRRIAFVSERRELFTPMNVQDHLELGAWPRRRESRARRQQSIDEVYARFPRLAERRRQAAGTLSGGERQMLAIGRALMMQPRWLLLDEPSLGLAPLIVRDIFDILVRLRSEGVGILLVEQNAAAALRIADDALVIENGRIVLSGAADALAGDEAVVASFLGMRSMKPQTLPQ